MTTKIQLSQVVVPNATAGQTLAVAAGGALVASNTTVSGGTNNARATAYSLVFGG